MNTFGRNLRITTFGESHGAALGGVIDGFPAGFKIDFEDLQKEISRRAPGSSSIVTQRNEKDTPEFLSGINENGITLGTPIGFIIRNSDNRSKDYSELADKYRPNHADFTYDAKFGIRDFRGGGRASARETANWVVAGALAKQWLGKSFGIGFFAELTGAGMVSFSERIIISLSQNPERKQVPFLSSEEKNKIEQQILDAKNDGDSVGGTVTCLISNVPSGLGDPVFGKLQARIAQAMMGINAAKGFEYGLGNLSSRKRGSEVLDIFKTDGKKIITSTNYSGGIQGGISNGMPIFFNVAFKPTPTIMKEIETVTQNHEAATLKMRGRHDPCVAVRAVPVVEALAALVIADLLV